MSENENAKTAGAPVGPLVGSPTGTLLVEARTEELPPQLLRGLAAQFPQTLLANLRRSGFADDESFPETDDGERNGNPKLLATPRRIVALLRNIRRAAADRMLVRRGPQVTAALDKDGRPTKALEGFLRATGKTVGDLRKLSERGREYFAVDLRESGGTLESKLAAIVQESLLSLNAPRLMRWGANDWRFIRPLRGLAMLWESEAIAGEVMGVKSGRETLGHRFMSEGPVGIPSAGEYEGVMEGAKVIVDFHARRQKIENMLWEAAEEQGAKLGPFARKFSPENGALVDDVSTICEFPRVHCGGVRPEFMVIPDFCFDLCLRKHQWCFPLINRADERLPQFLFVADNAPDDSAEMVRGFERVLAARLADVAFYLAEDRKVSTEENREKLKRIVYHEKLGSQFDRVERIRKLTDEFARILQLDGENRRNIARAAQLYKLDLPTLMVGEYPELEGQVAAECYADRDIGWLLAASDEECLAEAPMSPASFCLRLADHMEKLAGMFAAGDKPTGDKDPHGLRASAAIVADFLMECDVDLNALIKASLSIFPQAAENCGDEIYDFIVERSRRHFQMPVFWADNGKIVDEDNLTEEELQADKLTIDSVLSLRPSRLYGLKWKIGALQNFAGEPQANILIAANKRINNIFRKSGVDLESLPSVSDALFEHEEERALFQATRALRDESAALIKEAEETGLSERYGEALRVISNAAAPVDAFFDKVMVNADDEKVRANRFALLAELRALLNQVADISKLAG